MPRKFHAIGSIAHVGGAIT